TAIGEKHRPAISQVLAWENYRLAAVHANSGNISPTIRAIWRSIRHDPSAETVGYVQLASTMFRALTGHARPPLTHADIWSMKPKRLPSKRIA
ncbi:MAG TPA: hypothetical protein VJS64_03425, partial [Pyrinomonadaceae bacterium]|nr:hypothetical protein [Pyrinomonadaceae bacterium]